MRLLCFVLFLTLTAFSQATQNRKIRPKPVPKQTQIQPQNRFPLLKLNVVGNQIYTQQQIVAATGIRVGEPLDRAGFDQARERLMQTGAFETVGYKYGPTADGRGYEATFEVTEVEQLYPFRFEDLPASDVELRAYLAQREPLLRDKIPGTKAILDRFVSELQSYVDGKGFQDKIAGAVVADKPGELTVLFRPKTQPPAIAEVRFSGSQVVLASELQNTLAGVAVGVPYREATVRQLLETSIRPLFDGRGRLRAAFPTVTTEKAHGVDGVSVKIQVDEGPEFKFGAVNATGGVIPAREVVDIAALKKGDVANFRQVNAAIDRIQQRLRAAGYMHSQTRVERQIHDSEKTVDVTFVSTPGRQFKMGTLKVKGLDVVTEPVIRKLWTMQPGGPYNADYPKMFLDRVKEDGYFDNLTSTRFTQEVDEKTGKVDVTLYFKGGPNPDSRRRREPQP
jgi:outer membrane protein insertion porin family